MKKDEKGKTRKFIIHSLLLWLVLFSTFVLLQVIIAIIGDFEIGETGKGGFYLINAISGLIFISGLCGIPVIVFFAIILKFVLGAVDKIPNDYFKKNK